MWGELLTKATIWAALAGYAIGLTTLLLSEGRRSWHSATRIAWTAGCISLIAHIACAYHFFHGWNHASAYKETARQTFEVYGWYWGGGLYINFALMFAWIADVIWWWGRLDLYRRRSKWLSGTWHVFLAFIFFNATVVFEGGVLRWLWLLFTVTILFLWLYRLVKNSQGWRRKKPTAT